MMVLIEIQVAMSSNAFVPPIVGVCETKTLLLLAGRFSVSSVPAVLADAFGPSEKIKIGARVVRVFAAEPQELAVTPVPLAQI